MNTTGSDGAILSLPYVVKTKVRDYRFWGKQIWKVVNPVNCFGLAAMGKYLRKYTDPTVHDVPVIANNREYALFKGVRKFRFADGGAFDFHGDRKRTVDGRKKTLANSNQRDARGFDEYTFALPRDFKGVVGRYKLDWFFIRPEGPPERKKDRQPPAFAPWFARTYQEVNEAPEERISDHCAIAVDLPLSRPQAAH